MEDGLSGVVDAAASARHWVRTRRFGGAAPDPAMEEWFGSIGSIAEQLVNLLSHVRLDCTLDLAADRDPHAFLRYDLFLGLLMLLREGRYGWTNGLEEFTDPIWRERQHPLEDCPPDCTRPFGVVSAEVADLLGQLRRGFAKGAGWEEVGSVLRRLFVQACWLLILVEVE